MEYSSSSGSKYISQQCFAINLHLTAFFAVHKCNEKRIVMQSISGDYQDSIVIYEDDYQANSWGLMQSMQTIMKLLTPCSFRIKLGFGLELNTNTAFSAQCLPGRAVGVG